MAPEERLLSEFTIPTLDAWRARAARELRGKSPDDFRWHPDEGIEAPPLFTSADLAELPHLPARGLLLPDGPFRIRQRIDAATPQAAARHGAQAIAGGADELLIRFDALARRGADPGTAFENDAVAADAGEDGCAIYHRDALEQVLSSVDLAAPHVVAFDAGASGPALLEMLRESPHDVRAFELGLDPIGDLASGPVPGSNSSGLDAAWRAAEAEVPYAVHSAPYHRAGASAAHELGCVVATAIEYLRALIPDRSPDEAAHAICLRFLVGTDIYAEIAKLRAARLLWAKIAQAFEATGLRAKIHAESSPRSLAADDADTNLVRTNIHAFLASLAGCDSITLAPYVRYHDERDDHAQALARNQLILLRDEAMLQRVADPCGGSFAIEWLTDRLARGAWGFVQEIESRGGMVAALREGFVQDRIAASAATRREDIDRVRRTLVGVNRFVDPRFRHGTASQDIDTIEAEHFAFLEARGDDEATSTVGERMRFLRGDGWTRFPELLDQTPETARFEMLAAMVRDDSLQVLPILVGKPKLARARAEFARDLFAAGGFEVLAPRAPEDPIPDVAVLVFCGEDALVDRLLDETDTRFDGPRLCVAAPTRELDATFVFRGCDAYGVLRALYLDLNGDDDSGDEHNGDEDTVDEGHTEDRA